MTPQQIRSCVVRHAWQVWLRRAAASVLSSVRPCAVARTAMCPGAAASRGAAGFQRRWTAFQQPQRGAEDRFSRQTDDVIGAAAGTTSRRRSRRWRRPRGAEESEDEDGADVVTVPKDGWRRRGSESSAVDNGSHLNWSAVWLPVHGRRPRRACSIACDAARQRCRRRHAGASRRS